MICHTYTYQCLVGCLGDEFEAVGPEIKSIKKLIPIIEWNCEVIPRPDWNNRIIKPIFFQ